MAYYRKPKQMEWSEILALVIAVIIGFFSKYNVDGLVLPSLAYAFVYLFMCWVAGILCSFFLNGIPQKVFFFLGVVGSAWIIT